MFMGLSFLSLMGMGTGVEAQGVDARAFPAVFPAYTHPRVFTSAAELPEIKERLLSDGFGAAISPWLHSTVRGQVGDNAFLRRLATLDLSGGVTEADINDFFFAFRDGHTYALALMSLWATLFEAGEDYYVDRALETAIGAAVNHSILAEHIRDRYRDNNYAGLDAATESAIKGHWSQQSNYTFKLSHIWRNGGIGTAMAYDVLYHDMTAAQQAQVRRGLVVGTTGWNLHGGDDTSPLDLDGNAISNHYGYQGDQVVMLAAIYGEDGWSQADWDQGVAVLRKYMRASFYPSGACIEDSYGPNLGLREGARGLIAMARNGANEFADRPSEMYNIGVAAAHDIEAVPNGSLIGGESGGNYSLGPNSPSGENPFVLYPTFTIVWKHVYPTDPVIDHLYRWRVGEDYRRKLDWRATSDFAFFGDSHLAVHEPGLDETAYYPQRGKMIARDQLGDDSTQFVFDARPDAFAIGHDKSGRGHISLNALGRRWITHLNFRDVRTSMESSTVHIDGKGQAYKAPSVKVVVPPTEAGGVVSMAADLKYAYDWQWNEPWTFSSTASPRPDSSDPAWERETVDPRTFFPDGLAPPWVGNTLWDDPNNGYRGMWMWRRPNLPVLKAYRSVAYVRGETPFVIISDDIQQDEQARLYESYFQLPFDLDQMSVSGNDAILWAAGDSRRLLVRVLDANLADGGPVSFINQAYATSLTEMNARRLIVGLNAVDPQLKILLWPHVDGDALPQTGWKTDRSGLVVGNKLLLADDANGYTMFRGVPTPVIDQAYYHATGSLRFPSAVGVSYVVESSPDLVDGTWTPVNAAVQATGGVMEIPMETQTGEAWFYRIRCE